MNRCRGCLCVKAEGFSLCRVNKSPLMGLYHIRKFLNYFTTSRLGKWEKIIYILACPNAPKHSCNLKRSEGIWQERPKRSFDLIYWCLLFPSLVRFRHWHVWSKFIPVTSRKQVGRASSTPPLFLLLAMMVVIPANNTLFDTVSAKATLQVFR